jgi:pyruvate oxidase
MGVGIPGAITAKLDFPDRQVWSLAGDGATAMVMQGLATQVQEHLPIINVVFSNGQFGFIKDEQEDTNEGFLGVEFSQIDYAKVAEAMGVKGYSVDSVAQLELMFDSALRDIAAGQTVLIDAHISNERPIPVENLQLDSAEFRQRYNAENLRPLTEFLS